MLGDAREDEAKIAFRIDVVELAAAGERVDRRGEIGLPGELPQR
jgi:hypothetical protein